MAAIAPVQTDPSAPVDDRVLVEQARVGNQLPKANTELGALGRDSVGAACLSSAFLPGLRVCT